MLKQMTKLSRVALLVLVTVALARAQAPAVKPADSTPSSTGLVQPVSRTTGQLEMTAGLSADVLEPGTPLSVVVQVTPKKGMHVYAPGQDYKPVLVVLQTNPPVRIQETVYPTPIRYVFGPLKEEVLVYSEPFRLTRDVTPTDAERAQLKSKSSVTINGTLEYQACDDNVCYLPAKIPFEWSVRIKK